MEHLASELKGLEGVHEISSREKPERRNPACTGAKVCIYQVGDAAQRCSGQGDSRKNQACITEARRSGVSRETSPQVPTATEKENVVALDVVRNWYITHL